MVVRKYYLVGEKVARDQRYFFLFLFLPFQFYCKQIIMSLKKEKKKMGGCIEEHNKLSAKHRILIAIVMSSLLLLVGALGLGVCPKYDVMACEDLPCQAKTQSDSGMLFLIIKIFNIFLFYVVM